MYSQVKGRPNVSPGKHRCACAAACLMMLFSAGADAAAVKVNGVEIPVSFVEARERWTSGQEQMFRQGAVDGRQLPSEALRFAVEAEVARQELARTGQEVTPQEVDADIEAAKVRQGSERAGLLRMHGADEPAARELRRAEMNRERYARVWGEATDPVSGADIEGFYRQNYATYHVPERVRLEYMTLISTNLFDRRPDSTIPAISEELRRQVTEGGLSFPAAAAAARHSFVKVTAADGLFPVDGESYRAWEPALRGLKDGDVSQVLALGDNIFIILRPLGREPAVNRGLDEVREEIRAILLPLRRKELVEARFEELLRAATLVFPDPRYPPLKTAAP